VKAICPEPHDLAISKLVAWREKDQDYVRALVVHRIVAADELRVRATELEPDVAARVMTRLRTII
jgi:hypothetical protein